MFKFLYNIYFLYMPFRLVYINGNKPFMFNDKLDILGFEKINEGLKSFIKH